jgi:hypothetical protein
MVGKKLVVVRDAGWSCDLTVASFFICPAQEGTIRSQLLIPPSQRRRPDPAFELRWRGTGIPYGRPSVRFFLGGGAARAGWSAEDRDWLTFETVKLRINPELATEQREALRMDYELADESLEIRVRRSMKPYLLAGMFIDHKSHRDLPRHFILDE